MAKKWRSKMKELLQLKEQMEGREISVSEMATRIGVTRQTIYTWMSDSGVPTLPAEQTAKLEEYFGVSFNRLWELVEVDDEPNAMGAYAR